jgi:hypothetical protein
MFLPDGILTSWHTWRLGRSEARPADADVERFPEATS